MKFIHGCFSDIGNCRPNNEDAILVRTAGTDGHICMGVVCDGVGGMQAGEIASGMSVEALDNWAESLNSYTENENIEQLSMMMKKKIYEINEAVCRYSKVNHIKTGSTMSGILICGREYFTFNIGDSRVYHVKKHSEQLTVDDVRIVNDRSVLTQCIGGTEKIYISTSYGAIVKNDSFIFCSDGFYKLMKPSEVISGVGKLYDEKNVESLCKKLINNVKKRGENDNISLGIIKCV